VTGGIEGDLWSPADVPEDERLPLLVVHDGPEYDERAGLTGYLGEGVAGSRLPPLRAALLSPGDRNRNYSANARYAYTLARSVLTAPGPPAPVRIGMGTSLGALAMLHAHSRTPGLFDALFLQSGSFFTPGSDPQERRFPYFARVVRYTAMPRLERPIPVLLTCGKDEENLANNRLMTDVLRGHGYPATLHEVPGGHDWPYWHSAFDPHLDDLLRQAWP
jgi:enterochelin esterase-like enzyme